jgi:uncharacterized protein YkwD
MRSHLRHLGPVALIIGLLIGLVPAATAAEIDTSSTAMRAAEGHALALTNAQRTARGLVKLRLDTRLSELARDRAAYMASSGQFSHTQANGTDVFDMIDSSHITWYAAGEIIAWNTAGPLDYSAEFAVHGWMGSPSHKAIVLSSLYNYAGFGLAIAPDGTRYWAGVYLKGPDRTGGYARTGGFSKTYSAAPGPAGPCTGPAVISGYRCSRPVTATSRSSGASPVAPGSAPGSRPRIG